jgi:hypothetical protein
MKIDTIKFLKTLAFIFIISGIVISITYLLLIISGFISDDKTSFLQSTSIAGDFVGGVVGSLWSLAGVLLFYIALTYQTKEIKNQEAQITLQREELKNQIIELKETRDVFLLQNFENTFFNLLKNQRELVNNIECEIILGGLKQKIVGANFFEFSGTVLIRTYDFYLPDDRRRGSIENINYVNDIYYALQNIYELTELIRPTQNDELRIRHCYDLYLKRFSDNINHYFRHLYSILKFIKQHEKDIEKYRAPEEYSRILRSQMTLAELFLTFYNGLYFPKMKLLLEEYDLVKNLYVDDLLNTSHEKYYKTKLKYRYEERLTTN